MARKTSGKTRKTRSYDERIEELLVKINEADDRLQGLTAKRDGLIMERDLKELSEKEYEDPKLARSKLDSIRTLLKAVQALEAEGRQDTHAFDDLHATVKALKSELEALETGGTTTLAVVND